MRNAIYFGNNWTGLPFMVWLALAGGVVYWWKFGREKDEVR